MNLPSTICSPDDLHNMWKGIDGGFGYSVPQLFAVLIDTDGTPSKVLINIKDDGPLPCPIPELADHLVEMFEHLIGEHTSGGSVAVMRARPGDAAMTAEDGDWCAALHHSLMRSGIRSEPLYFATDAGPRQVVGDDLID